MLKTELMEAQSEYDRIKMKLAYISASKLASASGVDLHRIYYMRRKGHDHNLTWPEFEALRKSMKQIAE